MKLVIVESPAKAKTIAKFLGTDFTVVASYGHIRDLPKSTLGVDISGGFIPKYVVPKEKKKVVKDLQEYIKKAKFLYIATDEDREGEAIGWHICECCKTGDIEVKRIVFHEITKQAILESLQNPRTIDMDLVSAQQARRVLDRLVGYTISPLLWQKIRPGLSAGRVQSVAVRFIVEREREIQAFVPEEYWKIEAVLQEGNTSIRAVFTKDRGEKRIFSSRESVLDFFSLFGKELSSERMSLKNTCILSFPGKEEFLVRKKEVKEQKKAPPPPFVTASLQQEAFRKFGFSVKETMMLAQQLYEGIDIGDDERIGLITYMRTDSVNLSKEILGECREFILKIYGKQYHKERIYKTKVVNAQEAHEAIRPTSIFRTPESLQGKLDAKLQKLYTLIWERTLASQMEDARIEKTKYIFSPLGYDQEWQAGGSVILFDGFLRLYKEESEKENDEELSLPALKEGQLLECREYIGSQSFTEPPARYTEATLVKKLEQEGIGRPSTYATIIATIIERGYIEKKEKKYLMPTQSAFIVNDFLMEYFFQLMDYSFTRNIEKELDDIALGKLSYAIMLGRFWYDFLERELTQAKEKAEKILEKTGDICPLCGKELVYRYGKNGKFIGCAGYPECMYVASIHERDMYIQKLKERYDGTPCPEGVQGTVKVRVGKFGPFLSSSEYPKEKWIAPLPTKEEHVLSVLLERAGLLYDEETGEKFIIKKGKRGYFLASSKYPQEKKIKSIPKHILESMHACIQNNEFFL